MIYLPEIFVKKGEKVAGIYIISKDRKTNYYKVGMTTDLNKRLDSYHICFPTSFYIHGIITLKSKKLPVIKKSNGVSYENQTQGYSRHLERQLRNKILEYNPNAELIVKDEIVPSRYTSEWYNISKTKLIKLLKEVYRENKKVCNVIKTNFSSY